MVFVACVVVELEEPRPPVVVEAAALPPDVAAAEPDADALSVVLPLDVVLGEGDCEDDWESEDKGLSAGIPYLSIRYILLLL